MTFDPSEHDLKKLSHVDVDEERIYGLWRDTRKRMDQRTSRQAALRAGAAVTSVAALVALAFYGVGAWSEDPVEPTEYLALETGGVPGALDTRGGQTGASLSDGSQVTVSDDGRWVPLYNEPARFEGQLERGTVSFDVVPGGPRTWVVHAGTTRVEVLGTAFSVTRDGETTRVDVERGRVSVSDPRLEGTRLLGRGETLTIETRQAANDAPPRDAPPRDEDGNRLMPVVVEAPGDERPDRPARTRRSAPGEDSRSWTELAEQGVHGEAYERLGREGLRREASGADAARLMLLADIARLSGHPREAVRPLERLLQEAPRDERAPLAAIILGRLEMDRLRRPTRARTAFRRALALGVPQALRSDVERRLAELDAQLAEPAPE